MTRRQRLNADDSLDLLLDTITNAFGGILLLAILLALLVQRQTTEPTPETPTVSTDVRHSWEQQREALRQQKQLLEDSLKAQGNLTEAFVDDRAREVIQQLVNLSNQLQQKTEMIRQQTAQRAALDREMAALQETITAAAETLGQLQGELDATQAELQAEIARRTRTAQLPREQRTFKRMGLIIMTGGRFYVPDSSFGQRDFQLNTQDFEITQGTQFAIRLLDGRRLKIRESGGQPLLLENLQRLLTEIDSDETYLTLVVLPDAFESFHLVREACVLAGIEHMVFPLAKLPIYESQGSGTSRAQ